MLLTTTIVIGGEISDSVPVAEGVTLTAKASREPVALADVAVVLEPDDHVAIAKQPLLPGTQLLMADGSSVRVSQVVPPGHKVAVARCAGRWTGACAMAS